MVCGACKPSTFYRTTISFLDVSVGDFICKKIENEEWISVVNRGVNKAHLLIEKRSGQVTNTILPPLGQELFKMKYGYSISLGSFSDTASLIVYKVIFKQV